VFDRAVDSHIKNLRKKIDAVLPGADVVQSVYGLGYRYSPPV
jgi:two-component system response regulator BaeR